MSISQHILQGGFGVFIVGKQIKTKSFVYSMLQQYNVRTHKYTIHLQTQSNWVDKKSFEVKFGFVSKLFPTRKSNKINEMSISYFIDLFFHH